MFWRKYHENTKREKIEKKIRREYGRFKRSILIHSKLYIYQQTNRILFYGCISEYFMYNIKNIDEEIIDKLSNDNEIIAKLFKIYQEYEEFQVNTWKEIEELIDAYISELTENTKNKKETEIEV